MARRAYPTDLTDVQWAILEPLVPAPTSGARPAKHPRREIVNAMRSVLRGGIAWRLLPQEFSSLADGLRLLPAPTDRWHLGADQHRLAGTGPHSGWPRADAEWGDPRQSARQDDGKGGPEAMTAERKSTAASATS